MKCPSRQLISAPTRSAKFDVSLSVLFSGPFPKWRITPLCEEFRDLLNTRGVNLLLIPVLTKYELFDHSGYEMRVRMLKNAAVMPSHIIRTIAREVGCSTKFPRPSLRLTANRGAAERAARKLNVDRSVVSHCWKARADLDAQWHALRRALLQMHSSFEVQP